MNHTVKTMDLLKAKDIFSALQNMEDLCASHMLPLVIFRKRDFPMMKFNFAHSSVMKKKVFAPLYIF